MNHSARRPESDDPTSAEYCGDVDSNTNPVWASQCFSGGWPDTHQCQSQTTEVNNLVDMMDF